MIKKRKTTQDLKAMVSIWIDKTFNYIDLQNAEKVFDNTLFEFIESNCTEQTAHDFLTHYNYYDAFKSSAYDAVLVFANEYYEDEFRTYAEQDHYPMWNTLFEFRSKPSTSTIEAARMAGFGIIAASDYERGGT